MVKNIAIIGCGQIADAHMDEIRRIPATKIVAVCDANYYMAKQAAIRYGVDKIYTDASTMLEEVKPDVVHITTPPHTHLFLGKLALEAGAHIYMEKPFTVNTDEAVELVDLANKKGLQICVGHNSVFDPSFLALRKRIDNGEIGDVVHVDSIFSYSLDGPFGALIMGDPNHWLHRIPGGLAQNNISHPLSLILTLIGDDVTEVNAKGYKFREQRFGDVRDDFHDELRVNLVMGKKTATMNFSCSMSPVQLHASVQGTNGTAYVNTAGRIQRINTGKYLPGPFMKLNWARDEVKESKRQWRQLLKDFMSAKIHYFDGMKILIENFYHAIDGKNEMPITMAEAVRTTRVMDDIFAQIIESGDVR